MIPNLSDTLNIVHSSKFFFPNTTLWKLVLLPDVTDGIKQRMLFCWASYYTKPQVPGAKDLHDVEFYITRSHKEKNLTSFHGKSLVLQA